MELTANTAPKVHARVIDMLGNLKGSERYLDVAAGSGALLKQVISRFPDINAEACEFNPNLFKLSDIPCKKVDLNTKIDYPDNSFDVVTCIEVIEHLKYPWLLVEELHRITKSGGTLILSTPNISSFFSRLLYLASGRFINFLDKDADNMGHISPVFAWTLDYMIKGKFEIEKVTYNRSALPVLGLEFFKPHRFFGEVAVLKLKKI
jgi:2-polyprenyl-3-methyl-5-hydroxy-6-metoxy-1,4-benzoquinol methylase